MEATPIFALPFPEETDPPDGAAQIEGAVLKVEELLATIEGLLLGAPAPGDLLIVSGTSDPVYKAATGDVTNNSAGVFTIGGEKVATTMIKNLAITAAKIAEEAVETAKIKNLHVTEGKLAALAVSAAKLAAEAVETAKIKNLAVTTAKIALENVTTALIADLAVTEGKLADGAATSRKAKLTAGIKQCSGDVALEAAYKDITGTELAITPAVASLLIVTAIFDAEATESGAKTFQGTITVDGVAQTAVAMRIFATALERQTVAQTYAIALTAAEHKVKMQAKVAGVKVKATNTQYSYVLLAT